MTRVTRTVDLIAETERRWGPKHRWVCVYCGRGAGMTVDHFTPLHLGGTDTRENLVPACDRCNSHKMEHEPVAWMTAVGVPAESMAKLVRVSTAPREWKAPRDLGIPRTKLNYPAGRLPRTLGRRPDAQ